MNLCYLQVLKDVYRTGLAGKTSIVSNHILFIEMEIVLESSLGIVLV